MARLYKVIDRTGAVADKLVKATSKNQALKWCIKDRYGVTVASGFDVADFLSKPAAVIEDATSDDVA